MEPIVGRYSLPETVINNIDEARVHLFEEAAESTGYVVEIIARPGQSYQVWEQLRTEFVRGHGTMNIEIEKLVDPAWVTYKVREGQIGIAIRKPDSQRDHHAFWEAFRALKAEQTQPK